MKRILSLLMLIACGIGMGWAQTEVTATWFKTSISTEATLTSDDEDINSKFTVKGATVSTTPVAFKINGTRSGCVIKGQTETITTTNIQVPANTAVTNSTQMIQFILTPEAGITFKPKSIKLYAGIQSFGDKSNNTKNKFVNYTVSCGSATIVARTDIELGRNDSGTGITPITINLTDAQCDANNSLTFTLFLKGYSQTSAKNILLANIEVNGTVEGETQETTKYNVTTSVQPENSGTVTLTPNAESYNEGTNITLTATPATGYVFDHWSDTEGNNIGSTTTYSIESIAKDENITANFRKLPVITFTFKEEGVEGNDIIYNTLDINDKITIPTNNKFYLAGKTLTGWNDGNKIYKASEEYTIKGDATLSAVFENNSFDLAYPQTDITVIWNFNTKTGGAKVNSEGTNRPSDIYVTQATYKGKFIDVKMNIDASNGKCNNNGNDAAQTRNTIFTIPAAKGCEIEFNAGRGNVNVTKIDNEAVTPSGTKWTYKYNGSNTTINIETGTPDTYYSSFNVTYKASNTPYTLTTTDTDFYSLYLDYNATIPAGVTAYRGELSADETTLTVSEITLDFIPANYGVLVKSNEAGEFTFEESTSTGVMVSDLKGVTEDTDITVLAADPGKTVLTLGMKDGVAGFRQPAGTQIKANRAYLLVSSTNAAKGVKIAFDGETTGISDINAAKYEDDAPVYDLTGRRVSADAKGLLIKNGKKYINKK